MRIITSSGEEGALELRSHYAHRIDVADLSREGQIPADIQRERATLGVMDVPNRSALPDLATWPVFAVIIVLLLAALVLEVMISSSWTEPFREPSTWVLIGVVVGVLLRGVGQWLGRRELRGEETLRRLSLAVWIVTALGGLVSLLL